MKLMTKEVIAKLPALYSQEDVKDPQVVLKFFTPWTNWTWFVTEASPIVNGEQVEKDGKPARVSDVPFDQIEDVRFFGMVHGHEKELGYFMLSELQEVKGPVGLKIERDLHWTPKPLSALPQ